MSSFTQAIFEKTSRRTPNVFLWWGSRPYYKLVSEDFRYDLIFLGSPLTVRVEKGFETDFASIPWPVRWMFNLKRMATSAAVHDKMRESEAFSKLEGDLVFHMAMDTAGVVWWQKELAAFAVRFNNSRMNNQPR